jgi:hypothetical protein
MVACIATCCTSRCLDGWASRVSTVDVMDGQSQTLSRMHTRRGLSQRIPCQCRISSVALLLLVITIAGDNSLIPHCNSACKPYGSTRLTERRRWSRYNLSGNDDNLVKGFRYRNSLRWRRKIRAHGARNEYSESRNSGWHRWSKSAFILHSAAPKSYDNNNKTV